MYSLPSMPVLGPTEPTTWYANAEFWLKFNLAVTATGKLTVTAPDGTKTVINGLAALTQDVPLMDLPRNMYLSGIRAKTSLVFAGATTTVLSIGTASVDDEFLASYDLMAAVADTNYDDTLARPEPTTLGDDTLVALLTTTVSDVNTLTAGSVDIHLKLARLP